MAGLLRTFTTFLLLFGSAGSASGSLMLTLTPSTISGTPGSTTGWGFTLTNDVGYAEITLAQFCSGSVLNPCTPPDPDTFTDFVSVNDVIVGPPGGTLPDVVSQSFDELAQTGIGSFTIANGASGTIAGQILLNYNVWNIDPNTNGATLLFSDETVAAAASVVVNAASATPEPATGGLLLAGIAMTAAARRRFKGGSRQKRGES